MTIRHLHALGFDATTKPRAPRCSQCEVAVINGTPCHEQGCPNTRHECAGCNALIPAGRRFCPDCA